MLGGGEGEKAENYPHTQVKSQLIRKNRIPMHALTHTHTSCTWRAQPHAAAPPSALAGVRAQPQRPKAAKPAAQRSSCVCGRQGGSQKLNRSPRQHRGPQLLPAEPLSGGERDGQREGAEAAATAQLGPQSSHERRQWPLGGGGTHAASGAGREAAGTPDQGRRAAAARRRASGSSSAARTRRVRTDP